jgi:hypothetical protein
MDNDRTLRGRDLELAYALLRMTIGLNICMHGVVRCASGLNRFAESLVTMFRRHRCLPGLYTASASLCLCSKVL